MKCITGKVCGKSCINVDYTCKKDPPRSGRARAPPSKAKAKAKAKAKVRVKARVKEPPSATHIAPTALCRNIPITVQRKFFAQAPPGTRRLLHREGYTCTGEQVPQVPQRKAASKAKARAPPPRAKARAPPPQARARAPPPQAKAEVNRNGPLGWDCVKPYGEGASARDRLNSCIRRPGGEHVNRTGCTETCAKWMR